ncbi:hypothetical protein GCM10018785_62480 [Streptomyces longispororuber]|uniref:Uncharacterized protein n=1 Tax=Streptomyces longispororuber TaxID=68230 RepID=A0A919A5G4_9ACTN|nr:hypothetical protein [Streptomyces longispororuber]GHE86201.1 hypothetical protein GCM10018785_62480 [Streptomyces longispororuber]
MSSTTSIDTRPTGPAAAGDTGWGRRAGSRPRGRTVRRAVVGLAAAALLSGGVALTPAVAAPAPQGGADRAALERAGQAGPLGTAPACVQRSVSGRSATVTNKCGRTVRVKVVVKRGPDSRCHALKNRAWARHSWPLGSYDKTVTC